MIQFERCKYRKKVFSSDYNLTASFLGRHECHYCLHTNTFCLSGVGDEPLVTSASVTSHCVLATAVLTDAWFD